jgi:hypothetical protein
VDRRASPSDDPNRRTSHADKRRAWHRELLVGEIRGVLRPWVTEEKVQAVAKRLLALARESLVNRGKYTTIQGGRKLNQQFRTCFRLSIIDAL